MRRPAGPETRKTMATGYAVRRGNVVIGAARFLAR